MAQLELITTQSDQTQGKQTHYVSCRSTQPFPILIYASVSKRYDTTLGKLNYDIKVIIIVRYCIAEKIIYLKVSLNHRSTAKQQRRLLIRLI